MKIKKTIIALLVTFSTIPLYAANNIKSSLGVFSEQIGQGSVSLGEGNDFYTKKFKIMIINQSDKNADLSKFCLKAFSTADKEYRLDTIDEKLMTGQLAPFTAVEGKAVFAVEKENVYQATMIKISSDCH